MALGKGQLFNKLLTTMIQANHTPDRPVAYCCTVGSMDCDRDEVCITRLQIDIYSKLHSYSCLGEFCPSLNLVDRMSVVNLIALH